MKGFFKCFSAKTKPEDNRNASHVPPVKHQTNYNTAVNVSQLNFKDDNSEYASSQASNKNNLNRNNTVYNNGPSDFLSPN
jgi:hypothetical protein